MSRCWRVAVWAALWLIGTRATQAAEAQRVIVMIADGCGFGQREALSLSRYGKPGAAVWDSFPLQLAMSTYSDDGKGYDAEHAWDSLKNMISGPTDSAAAATAMATGQKTYNKALGVGHDKQPLPNVIERAEALGLATGVVTSVTWSHATPAGFVVHQPDRGAYEAIAKEMVNDSAVEVIMGGGHPFYDNDHRAKQKPRYTLVGGQETWDALVAGRSGGDADGDGQPDPFTLLTSAEDIRKLATGTPPKRVVATCEVADTLQCYRQAGGDDQPGADPRNEGLPTLADLSRGALNVLAQDPDGFFLMIEGGAVDWAGHKNQAGRMIEEMADFEDAVRAVSDWVDNHGGWDETLLIITGDHETGMLTGPDEDGLFAPLTFQALGKLPGLAWHSKGHSNSLIPFTAKGVGLEWYRNAADRTDPKRGAFLDNTSLAKGVFTLFE